MRLWKQSMRLWVLFSMAWMSSTRQSRTTRSSSSSVIKASNSESIASGASAACLTPILPPGCTSGITRCLMLWARRVATSMILWISSPPSSLWQLAELIGLQGLVSKEWTIPIQLQGPLRVKHPANTALRRSPIVTREPTFTASRTTSFPPPAGATSTVLFPRIQGPMMDATAIATTSPTWDTCAFQGLSVHRLPQLRW